MLNTSRRRLLAVVAAVFAVVAIGAPSALAEQTTPVHETGNPINDQGSSYHYRTYIRSITPHVHGLSVEVLEFADRLLLRNNTGKVVTIYGYEGEPYARVQPGGTVEQNVDSPAYYLNTNFYGIATVPSSASASAAPRWETTDRAGQFEWHDHRIHWMSPTTPPAVKNTGVKTKIFDWTVPISVGAQRGAIRGELFWVPDSSSAPVGAYVALAVIILASLGLVFYVRTRRRRGDGGDGPDSPDVGTPKEAW